MEPFVEDGVELRGKSSGGRVKDKGNSLGMEIGEPKVDKALRSGFPTTNRLTIREMLLENINRGTKDMQIMEFAQRESCFAPKIQWGQSCRDVWKVVI